MSIEVGFYPNIKYGAADFDRMFDGIIEEGVFKSIGDSMKVKASSGMTVSVGSGKVWFDARYVYTDAAINLTLAASSIQQARIDAIVVETGVTDLDNVIYVVQGTAAASPSRPTLTNTQHPLAYITVPAGATDITTANIENQHGRSTLPYVVGAAASVDADDIISNLEAEFEAWLEDCKSLTVNDNTLSNMASRLQAAEAALDEKASTSGLSELEATVKTLASTVNKIVSRQPKVGTIVRTMGGDSYRIFTLDQLATMFNATGNDVNKACFSVFVMNGDADVVPAHYEMPSWVLSSDGKTNHCYVTMDRTVNGYARFNYLVFFTPYAELTNK